jgi:hypothetical protein
MQKKILLWFILIEIKDYRLNVKKTLIRLFEVSGHVQMLGDIGRFSFLSVIIIYCHVKHYIYNAYNKSPFTL